MSKNIEMFFANMRIDRKSEASIKNYGVDLKQFEKFVNEKGLDLDKDIKFIDYPILNEFKLTMINLSANTINRKINTLKSFFKFLKKNKFIDIDVSEDLEFVKKEQQKKAFALNKIELKNIITTATDDINSSNIKGKRCDRFKKHRDLAIMSFLLTTGIRSSELTNLTLKDVDLETRYITVLGKGKKYRRIKISEKILNIYKGYLKERRRRLRQCEVETDIVFISYRGKKISCKDLNCIVKKHTLNAGIDLEKASKMHTHTTRHTYATVQIEDGINIASVSQILGHKSINTTISIYTHLSDKAMEEASSNIDDLLA